MLPLKKSNLYSQILINSCNDENLSTAEKRALINRELDDEEKVL